MAVGELIATWRARLDSLPGDTRTAWKWDLTSAAFAGLYQGCIWTFVSRVARADEHASGPQMAWIAAAPAIGYLFSTVWARHMEGRAPLPFVYWTWFVARGMFMLAPLLTTRSQYVALVCAAPILFSVSPPAYTAIMKDIYPDRLRGRLMSYVRMAANLLILVAAFVAGRLLDHGLNYHTLFGVGGVFGALSAIAFGRIPVQPVVALEKHDRTSTFRFILNSFNVLRHNRTYRWFSCAVVVSGFGNIMGSTLYPIHQVDHFHITNTQVANLQNIASITTVAGYFFWGRFLDKRGPLRAVLVAIGINTLVPLTYAVATHVSQLYFAAAFGGMALSGIDLAYINATLLFAENGSASQYQAIHSTLFGIRGTIAPNVAIPVMYLLGARGAFVASFCLILAGVAIQVVSLGDKRKDWQVAT